jgi:hypothetical protein
MVVASRLNSDRLRVLRRDLSYISLPVDSLPTYFGIGGGRRPGKSVPRSAGYSLSSRSRVGVRAAGQAFFLTLKENVSYSPYFITLTFPDVPSDRFSDKSDIPYQERDKFCHELFKRWIRYEKTRHGLISYVWVNERQSGERGGVGRGMVHYHIVALYSDTVSYKSINLRWLRLLAMEGLQVFSEYAPEDPAFRDGILSRLIKSEYGKVLEHYHAYDSDRKRHSIFRCPLDITPVVANKGCEMRVINYLLKYISKDDDDLIYVRRWGYSINLRVNKDVFKELVDMFTTHIVDTETGIVVESFFESVMYHKVFGSPPLYGRDGTVMFGVNITDDLPPDFLRLLYRYFNIDY